MNGVLTAASKNFRSIGGDPTNFYSSASSVDRVSEEVCSQQAFIYALYISWHQFQMTSLLRIWLPIALLGCLPFFIYRFFPPATFLLEIDAEVSAGQSFQIFLNDEPDSSLAVPVVPGTRHQYAFEGFPPSITSLRIDLGEQPGSEVRLLAARTFRNDVLVKEVVFNQDSGFRCWGCEKLSISDDSTQFITTSNDPIFIGDYTYRASLADRLWVVFGGQLSMLYLKIAIACILLLLLMPFSPRKGASWLVGLPLILLPVLVPIFSYFSSVLSTHIVSLPDFSQAVGFSSFIGRPKQDENLILYILVAACLLLAGLLFVLVKKTSKAADLPGIELPAHLWKRNHMAVVAAVLTGIAVVNFPDVENTLTRLATWSHPADWDAQSLGTWRFAVSKALLPYRDFWFPYGGAWNENGLFTGDQLRFFVHCVTAYGVFFVLIFTLAGGQVIATLLFSGLIWWGAHEGYLGSLYRYLLPINMLLFYCVLLRSRVSGWLLPVLFGVYLSWVFAYESTLAAYGFIPIFLLCLLQAVQNLHNQEWRNWFIRTHWIAVFTCVLGISVFLLSLYRDGQLAGYVEFHRDLQALSLIAAVPGEIPQWLRLTERPDNLVTVATLLLLFWGCWLILWYWKKPEQWLGIYLFFFGCLSFAIYNKYLMRPHMSNQFLVVPLVGVFLYFTTFIRVFPAPQRTLLRISGVCVFAALYFSPVGGVVEPWMQRARAVFQSVHTLVYNNGAIRAAEADFYSSHRFTKTSPAALEIYDYVKQQGQSGNVRSIYVLGQDQYLYMLLDKSPPYYLTIWEGGTQRAQVKTLEAFASAAPDLIFYNPSVRSFDGVPDQARAPRLYQHVVENYRVIGEVDKYVVLGPRSDSEAIDYRRWGELLGQDVALGYIPGSTSFDSLPDCGGDASECGDYLVVTLAEDPGVSSMTASLPTEFGEYSVTWSTRAKQLRYTVPLLRLWFWPILPAAQKSNPWKIATGEATFEVVEKGGTGHVLY